MATSGHRTGPVCGTKPWNIHVDSIANKPKTEVIPPVSYIFSFSLSVCLSQTGNGPSGISLSYMLAGHWPYWSPEKAQKHPDELLRARLNYYDAQKSLVEHDLFSLADGLEGRSTNPVSLLVSTDRASGLDLLEWNNDLLTSLVGVLLPFLFPPFPAGQFAASVCRFGHGSAPDGRVPASSGEGGKQSNSHR